MEDGIKLHHFARVGESARSLHRKSSATTDYLGTIISIESIFSTYTYRSVDGSFAFIKLILFRI
jgi:hypothetical protein